MATIAMAGTTASQGMGSAVKKFLWENSLSLALFGIFFATLVGQVFTGLAENNQTQQQHGEALISLGEYLTSGHFIEALFENWESEFLQMAAYVMFTVYLRQKGSSESKQMEGEEKVDEDPRLSQAKPGVPWPVRKGGLILKLYENSLFIAFALLFVFSFSLHAVGGAMEYNDDQRAHGSAETVSVPQYVATSRFWFESFQNWQSEFFSLGMVVVLSIFLRQRSSPESKEVAAPHSKTGTG